MKIFLVAGEHSGDQLGFKLMQAIRAKRPDVTFLGVGGEAMEREGLKSLFPLSDIAVMGILPVVPKIPTIHERIHATVSAIMIERPDVLVIIDSLDENVFLASRNLPNVLVLEVNEADPVSLIRFPKVLITKSALAKFEEILG